MALPILDGNQSATTLSSILTSGEHIPAHTVVSLGTQAITDMRGAVSGSVVSISNFPATQPVSIASVTVGNSVTIGSLPAISGTVTVSNAVELAQALLDQSASYGSLDVNIGGVGSVTLPISGTVTANVSVNAFTNTQGGIAADDGGGVQPNFGVQLGYFDGDDYRLVKPSHPLPISGTVTVGNSVTIGSLPLIAGTVTANVGNPSDIIGGGYNNLEEFAASGGIPVNVVDPISGTVTANTFALQGTAVTTSNFTSTTASTVLAGVNANRKVLTIFNEGAGNLHICAGATCTTIAYQVRLSAGDYYEVPNHQTTITHSAVFATAGTARVTEVS